MTFRPWTMLPSDIPPEWDDVDLEIWQRIRPDRFGFRTPAQQEEVRRIRRSRYLLLTNEHRARCRECGQIHHYMTLSCVERPFNSYYELSMFERQVARQRGSVRGENIIQTDTRLNGVYLGDPVPISYAQARKLSQLIQERTGYDLLGATRQQSGVAESHRSGRGR